MTMYLVTSGCYSDYGVVAVYDDRALAEAFVAGRGDDYNIEEYELNPHADDIRAQTKIHRVVMDRAGNTLKHESWYGGEPTQGAVVEWNNWRAPKKYRFQVYVRASSDEQAIKAANEYRAVWIAANKEWPEDEPEQPKPFTPSQWHIKSGDAFSIGFSTGCSTLAGYTVTVQGEQS